MSQFLSRPAERPASVLGGSHSISSALSKTPSIDHQKGSWLDSRSPDYPSLLLANLTSSVHSVHSQDSPCIGSGSFGSVYLAKEESGTLIAVKEIELRKLGPDKTVNEFELGKKKIRHPNIVEYLGVEIHPDKVCIFLEYCEGGSLANVLQCEGRIADQEVLLAYTLQILEALAYLHSCGIVHGDIKPANILLDGKGSVKISDFGSAEIMTENRCSKGSMDGLPALSEPAAHLSDDSGLPSSVSGTVMYMPPETVREANGRCRGATDIWSLGCVVFELSTGKRPWSKGNESAIHYQVGNAICPPELPEPDQLSKEGIRFLGRCWAMDPDKRPTAADLLQDQWMATFRSALWSSE
ncbi:hypothetical protein HWV62_24616 [Athelia sp. TMB]|nr:hypothetical protein HWV62_24616 [Athelia sp. TMB]